MKYALRLSLPLAVMLLAACSLFNVEKPDTFNQRLAYVYGTEQAVAQQIAEKTRAGVISSDDNKRFVAMVENAKQVADGARAAMSGGDTSTAEGKLLLAKNVLTEVDAYVRSKK
jgi:hypothetical protein